jgi:hypothetical protein
MTRTRNFQGGRRTGAFPSTMDTGNSMAVELLHTSSCTVDVQSASRQYAMTHTVHQLYIKQSRSINPVGEGIEESASEKSRTMFRLQCRSHV